ncbi:MAG TPA: DUF1501 domain-containing protein [Pirellulales bacterium]|nr:DUF1501 domain-containing protein [Pirellulales bacterium]
MALNFDGSASIFRRTNRRELLRIGGLSLVGLSAADLNRLRAHATNDAAVERRRQNACVFVFLFGGPSHIDLWDMKPEAPSEVRGEFKAAATKVPGIHLCEHLPLLAGQTDKICLLRSMTHRMNVHGPACSEIFSGREYFGPPTTDQASREDWPSLSALTARYGKSQKGLPPAVVLPWYLQFPGQPKRIAGQTGGRMGEQHNAFLVEGDFGRSDFQIQGLRLTDDIPWQRIAGRRELLHNLASPAAAATEPGSTEAAFNLNRNAVYSLLETKTSEALELPREPLAMRERYGQTAAGQSLLMARRLIEAGVSLVTVNWQDETKIDGVNTCWDTHQNNFAKLKDLLCPIFDRAFSAFVSDLHDRGLLETTLVVAVGEFGRTPKIGQFTQSSNTKSTGRDHWPHAFTALLAGGGVRGGQVYGQTTRNGGYVADKPVTPADLSATILHHLGVDFRIEYEDDFQHRRHRLSEGRAVTELFG